jgi:Zn-dependent protease with chaperone function
MDVHQVRFEADRSLAVQFLADPMVQSINKKLLEEGKQHGIRRHFLARALRLSPAVAPTACGVVKRCVQALDVSHDVELFVFPSADYNAACTPTEQGRVFVLLSSSLLECFDEEELTFVIGHELGHHIYGHHDIPASVLLSGQVPIRPVKALQFHAWQRYAEISADRAGLLCCESFTAAARSFFKLSSGLHMVPTEERIQAFVEQADELFREAAAASGIEAVSHGDWLSSHPFSPIRLRSARAFSESVAFSEDGTSWEDLELGVQDLLGMMEANYLKEDSVDAEAMRRLLFAAGVVLASLSSDGIVDAEVEALRTLLGPRAIPFKLNPELLREHLDERVASVMAKVRPARRAQLLRDLVVLARADGRVDPTEREFLLEMARRLSVSPEIALHAIDRPLDLD